MQNDIFNKIKSLFLPRLSNQLNTNENPSSVSILNQINRDDSDVRRLNTENTLAVVGVTAGDLCSKSSDLFVAGISMNNCAL